MELKQKQIQETPKGYTCDCGKFHKFPSYVYAHWSEYLNHTCDCGNINELIQGYRTDEERTDLEINNEKI